MVVVGKEDEELSVDQQQHLHKLRKDDFMERIPVLDLTDLLPFYEDPKPKKTAKKVKKRQRIYRVRYFSPDARRKKRKGTKFQKFLWALFDIFATRDLAPRLDTETYLKFYLRQFFVHVYFLICLSALAFGTSSVHSYTLQKSMADLFINEPISAFDNENDVPTVLQAGSQYDFWTYLEEGLLHNLHWEYYYNFPTHVSENPLDSVYNVKPVKDAVKLGILYENEVMGVLRIRQIRQEYDRCQLAADFHYLSRICYSEYDSDFEDKGDKKGYWKGYRPKSIAEAFRYQSEAELGGSSHWGEHHVYSGSGAVQNLGKTKAESYRIIQQLKLYQWLDRSTKAVFIDFTVFNANVNLFCTVRISWEFLETGSLFITHKIQPFRLLSVSDFHENYVLRPCRISVIILILYYLIQEIMEFPKVGWLFYITSIWCLLDAAMIISSTVAMSTYYYLQYLTDRSMKDFEKEENFAKFHNYEYLRFWSIFYSECISCTAFLGYARLYKYLGFNKTMGLLVKSLDKSSDDIRGFSAMFFSVFMVFAFLGYLQFGKEMTDFRAIDDSMFTLLRLILGDFDFQTLSRISPVFGPCFFVAYIFFIFFILTNMYLAIINDNFSNLRAEYTTQRNEFEMTDYIERSFYNIPAIFGRRSTKIDAVMATRLAPADGQLPYEEVRKNFEKGKFSVDSIGIFVRHKALRTDRFVDEEDAEFFIRTIEHKHAKKRRHMVARQQRYTLEQKTLESNPLPEEFEEVDSLEWTEEGVVALSDRFMILEGMFIKGLNDLKKLSKVLKKRNKLKEKVQLEKAQERLAKKNAKEMRKQELEKVAALEELRKAEEMENVAKEKEEAEKEVKGKEEGLAKAVSEEEMEKGKD